MYEHHITDMADALQSKGLVPSGKHQEVCECLQGYWADKIAITWCVEDIAEECPGLDKGQASEVLQEVLMRHDSERGVTWDVIHNHAAALFGELAFEGEDDDECAN